MQKSLHVYVCSTYRDLVSERNATVDALEELSAQYSGLTFFCPRTIQPLETCKEELGHSEVLILIIGHLQGVIAPGLDISHGEAEYQEGMALGKTVLVYFRDEKSGIYPVHFERDAFRATQLKTFKEKLSQHHSPKIFQDLNSLALLITEDLTSLAINHDLENQPGQKQTRFRGRNWVTRKIPTVNPATPVQTQSEHLTRTIPIFQKALATPFERRKFGSRSLGKSMLVVLVMLVFGGVALSNFYKHTALKDSPTNAQVPKPAGALLPPALTESDSLSFADRSPLGGENPEVIENEVHPSPVSPIPVPQLKQKSVSSVVMMDDTDSTKTFIRMAMQGAPSEQFKVGQMYEQGKVVPRNDTLALSWYRKAADKGWSEAQYKIALMYRMGKGAQRSSYQAAKWFQAAAAQGHAKAQFKLGQMYQFGKGVSRNETTAFKWFLKAADQNDPDAEKMLAELKEN